MTNKLQTFQLRDRCTHAPFIKMMLGDNWCFQSTNDRHCINAHAIADFSDLFCYKIHIIVSKIVHANWISLWMLCLLWNAHAQLFQLKVISFYTQLTELLNNDRIWIVWLVLVQKNFCIWLMLVCKRTSNELFFEYFFPLFSL